MPDLSAPAAHPEPTVPAIHPPERKQIYLGVTAPTRNSEEAFVLLMIYAYLAGTPIHGEPGEIFFAMACMMLILGGVVALLVATGKVIRHVIRSVRGA